MASLSPRHCLDLVCAGVQWWLTVSSSVTALLWFDLKSECYVSLSECDVSVRMLSLSSLTAAGVGVINAADLHLLDGVCQEERWGHRRQPGYLSPLFIINVWGSPRQPVWKWSEMVLSRFPSFSTKHTWFKLVLCNILNGFKSALTCDQNVKHIFMNPPEISALTQPLCLRICGCVGDPSGEYVIVSELPLILEFLECKMKLIVKFQTEKVRLLVGFPVEPRESRVY